MQAGAAKRLGKTLARGRAGMSGDCSRTTGNTPGEGGRKAGAGDGTVAMGVVTCACRRGAAGMSSRAMYSRGLCPRC